MQPPIEIALDASLHHERVRSQHQRERTQDYVEGIYRLTEAGEPVRVSTLQNLFGVSHVTVIRALAQMEAAGLVCREDRIISLSEEGRALAIRCYERHALVEAFLIKLGVSGEIAAADAEGIEHHLSGATLEAMKQFLET